MEQNIVYIILRTDYTLDDEPETTVSHVYTDKNSAYMKYEDLSEYSHGAFYEIVEKEISPKFEKPF